MLLMPASTERSGGGGYTLQGGRERERERDGWSRGGQPIRATEPCACRGQEKKWRIKDGGGRVFCLRRQQGGKKWEEVKYAQEMAVDPNSFECETLTTQQETWEGCVVGMEGPPFLLLNPDASSCNPSDARERDESMNSQRAASS